MNENENENETQNTISFEQTNTISFEQTNSTNPEPAVVQGNMGGKKKGKGILVIPIILIIAIITAAVYYFVYYTSTEQFYKRLLGSGVEAIAMSNDEENYKSYKAGIKLDMNFESETEEIGSEVEELINELEVGIETQIDKESEQLVVKIESEYDNEELINLDLYSNTKDEKTYIYAKEFLDKYLEVELEDEYYTEIAELFETKEGNIIQQKKAAKIFTQELSKMVKSEYCETENEKINVNGKEVKATRRTIQMTYQQFADEFITAFENVQKHVDVRDSREFAKLVANAKIEMQDAIEGSEDLIIKVNIYTTGILSKVVKVEIVIIDEEEPVTLAVTQIDNDKYAIEILLEDEVIINSNLDMSKTGTMKFAIDIEKLGKLDLDIEYNEEYDINIDKVDKKKSSTLEELTQEEQLTLVQNLQKSPIYTFIQQFADTDTQMGNDITIDTDIDTDINTDINTDTSTDTSTNTNVSKLNDNQILTYDDETLITFGIPVGYKINRISDNYQTIEKGNTDITITSSYDDEQGFYNDLEKSIAYYKEQTYYKDVALSEIKTMTIGNNTFNCATATRTSVSGSYEYKYNTLYIWKKVSDNYVLEIEIEEPSGMTKEELNQLLTLTVETSNM